MPASPALLRHVKCPNSALLVRAARCASTKIIADGVTITKKRYIDFPSGYVSADGVVNPPLPPFGNILSLKVNARRLAEQTVAAGQLPPPVQSNTYRPEL